MTLLYPHLLLRSQLRAELEAELPPSLASVESVEAVLPAHAHEPVRVPSEAIDEFELELLPESRQVKRPWSVTSAYKSYLYSRRGRVSSVSWTCAISMSRATSEAKVPPPPQPK